LGQRARPPAAAGAERVAPNGEITGDHRLLAILASADVEEVVLPRRERRPESDRFDLELVPACSCAMLEHGDVPAVGVDVEVLGVEMPDPDDHAASSQYGRVRPRLVAIAWSASIAVYVGRTASSSPGWVSSRPRSSARSSEET